MRAILSMSCCMICSCTSTTQRSTTPSQPVQTSEPIIVEEVIEEEVIEEEVIEEDISEPVSSTPSRYMKLASAIQTLQPNVEDDRALRLATIIWNKGTMHEIHPYLIAAIIMRESSYSTKVESCIKRGRRGELGLMQIMPYGAAYREGGRCDQRRVSCNIHTGVNWMSRVRTICGNHSTWRWVAAYGMRGCPSIQTARQEKSARRARHLLCDIRGDCNEIWPN